MGTISNASVSVALNGNTVDALFKWTTDVPATSMVTVSPLTVGATPGGNSSRDMVTSHSLTVSGLTPDADYSSTIASVDGDGSPCGYDSTVPNGILTFSTPTVSGPADSVSVAPASATTTLGNPVTLNIGASSGGSSVGGRDIYFAIHNGEDRGSFSPDPAQTVQGATTPIVFTPKKKGKAQIQILVDKVSKNVDVIVN